ncbi:MAG TPA: hypothetical protein DCK95_10695 [Anaerolineaceae bacterium]|nr:hypothetical protein [Anaerolineaceae bacterium]
MIRIGDYVEAKLIAQIKDNQWKVNSSHFSKNTTAILVTRSTKLYNKNDIESLWAFDIRGNNILLSDSQFGRLPISDRMRPRYIISLQSVLSFLDSSEVNISVNPKHFSEVKGMLNRCVCKDQWDWFPVYEAFNFPPMKLLAKMAIEFGKLAKAYKNNDELEKIAAKRNILDSKIDINLRNGLSKILENTPKLNSATSFKTITITKAQNEEIILDKNEDPFIVSQVSRARIERANKSHEHTLQILVNTLQKNGFQVEYSKLIDAYCRLKTGPAIFEVKSITSNNERSQSRKAISQLYEYRYLHSVPNSSLWIVFSRNPFSNWIVNYLENDRGIGVLWVEKDILKGRSIQKLFNNWK